VVDRQRAISSNVAWQWCVNSLDMGGIPAESYWPGADYVDIMSIDAYNGYGAWASAVKTIKPMYDRLCALDPTAPIWIAELGCRAVAPGETYSKAQWLSDLFNTTQFPRLTTVMFFNQYRERDWRVSGEDVRCTVSDLLAATQPMIR
jgi:beta-mannanase